jgi:hypothetical protein
MTDLTFSRGARRWRKFVSGHGQLDGWGIAARKLLLKSGASPFIGACAFYFSPSSRM